MISHAEVLRRLEHFEKAVLGKALWASCTHNQGAGIPPQCVDGIELWVTKELGVACISTGGNNARGLFDHADPKVWERIKNTRRLVVRPGDICVYGHRRTGHTDIGLPGSTRRNIVGLDQNWSWRNHFTKENHPYGELIGVLRLRAISDGQIHEYHAPEVGTRLGRHHGTFGISVRAAKAAVELTIRTGGATIRKERRGPIKVYVVRELTEGDLGPSHGIYDYAEGIDQARRMVNGEGYVGLRLEG